MTSEYFHKTGFPTGISTHNGHLFAFPDGKADR